MYKGRGGEVECCRNDSVSELCFRYEMGEELEKPERVSTCVLLLRRGVITDPKSFLNIFGYINVKKFGHYGSCISRKTQNRPKNRHICAITHYRFTKVRQCNSASVITPCDRRLPGRKTLPT